MQAARLTAFSQSLRTNKLKATLPHGGVERSFPLPFRHVLCCKCCVVARNSAKTKEEKLRLSRFGNRLSLVPCAALLRAGALVVIWLASMFARPAVWTVHGLKLFLLLRIQDGPNLAQSVLVDLLHLCASVLF